MKLRSLMSGEKLYCSVLFLILFFIFYTQSSFAFYDEFIEKHLRGEGIDTPYEDPAEASASVAMSKAAARKLGITFTPRVRPRNSHLDKAQIRVELKSLLTEKYSKSSLNKAFTIRKFMSGNTDAIDVYITLCLWEIGEEKEAESYSRIHLSEKKASKLHLHLLTKSFERHDAKAASQHLEKIQLSNLEYFKWKASIICLKLNVYIILTIILVIIILLVACFKIRNYLASNVKLKRNVSVTSVQRNIRTPQTVRELKGSAALETSEVSKDENQNQ